MKIFINTKYNYNLIIILYQIKFLKMKYIKKSQIYVYHSLKNFQIEFY